MYTIKRQAGISLIELIIFIVIVSTAVAGVLSIMNITTQHSADPMLHKQAQAIAESLLEEIELQPFTYCDPDDANAATATSTAGCATLPETMGPEPGETRYGTPQFDNVNDYDGFAMTGINDITNTPVNGLSGYTASVAINPISNTELQINVTVSSGSDSLTLTGYRFRYAPNAVP
ncbi:type II secretion system protein [Sulfuriferula nivalis]|nr:type II secretion system protein [Sulfuriferula nivalis]